MTRENAISIARSFLDLMEDREVDKARALLAPDFQAIYPGDRHFKALEDLASSGSKVYCNVRKQHDLTLHVPADADGIETVIFYGTLRGSWADGRAFEGIRFTDRFRIRGSLIVEQQVWNDIGQVRLRLADIE